MKYLKTLFAVALICAIGTVGYNAYADANMSAQERLIFANVEALTSGEYPGGGGDSSVTCYEQTESVGGTGAVYKCLTLTSCYFCDGHSSKYDSKTRTCTDIKK